jgi:hypothetical protein
MVVEGVVEAVGPVWGLVEANVVVDSSLSSVGAAGRQARPVIFFCLCLVLVSGKVTHTRDVDTYVRTYIQCIRMQAGVFPYVRGHV